MAEPAAHQRQAATCLMMYFMSTKGVGGEPQGHLLCAESHLGHCPAYRAAQPVAFPHCRTTLLLVLCCCYAFQALAAGGAARAAGAWAAAPGGL